MESIGTRNNCRHKLRFQSRLTKTLASPRKLCMYGCITTKRASFYPLSRGAVVFGLLEADFETKLQMQIVYLEQELNTKRRIKK